MKLEQSIFSETILPDIFFSDYLPSLSGNSIKVYMYIIFLSKYNKEIKISELSQKLNIPLNELKELIRVLEESNLIINKPRGFVILDLKEIALHKLYTPKISISKEKIEQNEKNTGRIKAIEHLNNSYFQGIMSPSWYSDIDLWFTKYNFDEQVMITLFDYCYKKGALHKNYVQTVAEAWAHNSIKSWGDLDSYYKEQDKLTLIKKSIIKKLNKFNGLTKYEEAYVETWVQTFKYDMSIIELALKKSTSKQSITFDYLNTLLTDWHEHNLTKPNQIEEFLVTRKKQEKDTKALKKQVAKSTYDQRKYDNLDYLYANNSKNEN